MDSTVKNGVSSVAVEKSACAIEGVFTVDLDIFPTPGGAVLHMLREDFSSTHAMAEVYFSEVAAGAVKAWKMHTKQTQMLAVPVGELLVVLYDDRPESPTYKTLLKVLLGREKNYKRLCIPPYVWYGFFNERQEMALICNCTDIPHDPCEARQKSMDGSIPYMQFEN